MHQPTMHTRSKAKPAKSAFNAALDQEDHGIQENIPVSAKPKPKPRAPKTISRSCTNRTIAIQHADSTSCFTNDSTNTIRESQLGLP